MFHASLETCSGRLQKAPDIAAAGKMLAGGAQHDDPYPRILVDRFEQRRNCRVAASR
jgi:hypothetical protein